jgi:hypothetical protein
LNDGCKQRRKVVEKQDDEVGQDPNPEVDKQIQYGLEPHAWVADVFATETTLQHSLVCVCIRRHSEYALFIELLRLVLQNLGEDATEEIVDVQDEAKSHVAFDHSEEVNFLRQVQNADAAYDNGVDDLHRYEKDVHWSTVVTLCVGLHSL